MTYTMNSKNVKSIVAYGSICYSLYLKKQYNGNDSIKRDEQVMFVKIQTAA